MMDGDFEKTLEILREAHREAIPDAHFAAVRARVLAQLETEQRPWWRGIRGFGFASAAVAAILLAAFWPKHTVAPRPVAPVAITAEQPARPLPLRTARESKRSAAVRRPQRHVTPAAYRVVGPPVPQHLMVKLVTNDPNVVIYWITGE